MMWFDGMGWFGWLAMARRSARHVLDERFAAGELSVADYEERRSVLG